jgi:hypothetical protein
MKKIAGVVIVLGIPLLFVLGNMLRGGSVGEFSFSPNLNNDDETSVGIAAVKIERKDIVASEAGQKIAAAEKRQGGLVPFDLVTIKGSGFDELAAVSVIFTTGDGNLTIPALTVTADQIEVFVPPVGYSKVVRGFIGGATSIKVIQTKRVGEKLAVSTSNEIPNLMILKPKRAAVLDSADAKSLPAGTITRLMMVVSQEYLKTVKGKLPAGDQKMNDAYAKAEKDLKQLIADVGKIKKDPTAKILMPTNTGATLTLGVEEVAWLDAFYAGYLSLLQEQQTVASASKEKSFEIVRTAEAFTAGCREALDKNYEGRESTLDGIMNTACTETENVTGTATGVGNTVLPAGADFSEKMLLAPIGVAAGILCSMIGAPVAVSVGVAIALPIGLNILIDGKLPRWDALYGAVGTIGEELNIPLIGPITTMLGFHNSICEGSNGKLKCVTMQSVWSGVGDRMLYVGEKIFGPFAAAFMLPDNYGQPIELENIGSDNGGYDDLTGDGKTTPTPSPTPTPTPVPNPTPITPDPTPKPNPTPKPLSCWDKKQASYDSCIASCGPDLDISSYNSCQSGCDGIKNLLDKSNCSNNCIGAWQKLQSAHSKCFTDCLNADYAYKCP